jgi:N,N'-diacetyllegionaminate synthase
MRCLVIAEAGVNHNGRQDVALQLIEAAAGCGADIVKFQTFTAENLVTKGTSKAVYQEKNTGAGDQYTMLKGLELPLETYQILHKRASECGIEFLSTPFDAGAADMLVGVGVYRLKVPSGELTNHPFLKYLARFGLPMILSTGMGTLQEIEEAIAAIQAQRSASGLTEPLDKCLTLLHCTSNYPAQPSEVNLRAMHTMRQAFGLPVGYSDHTADPLTSVVAVAAGAVVIEKHFTLDRNAPGPDHRASLQPDEFAGMVNQIRSVEVMLGSSDKVPCDAELPIRDLVRRSVTTRRTLVAGQPISADDITLLRPGTGIQPKELEHVIGRRVARDIQAGTTLRWQDLEA